MRIKPESKQRLAESFETALTLAQGRVIALDMDTNQEYLFSSRYACPVCSHSLPELEPRLFSFNNPVGACAGCDGLGHAHALRRGEARRGEGGARRSEAARGGARQGAGGGDHQAAV